MVTTSVEPFFIMGISIRTTNEHQQAAKDIPALWQQFWNEDILSKIPDKTGTTLYCAYTNYESDFTKPYTTVLGCKVSSLENIPGGLTGKTIQGGNYTKFTATGNLMEGIVFNEWTKIWNTDLPRAYTVDFEVYDERSQDAEHATVDILIALK